MRGLKKSKRVSWASDVNLCQTRLFLSDEIPSQVGLVAQDHLQAKTLGPQHTTVTGSDDNLPPGFEGAHPANLLINKLSQIPLPKWRCPPRFVMDSTWQVVAGDESQQVEVQIQREMRILEAVYPRPSSIPLNPSELPGLEDCHYNDQDTPSIPITAIEDEDSTMDSTFDTMAANTMLPLKSPPQIPSTSQSNGGMSNYPQPPANGNPDLAAVAAAYAALTSVMNTNQGKSIDRDLLTRIFSDPNLVDKLVSDHEVASSAQIITPKPRPPGISSSDPHAININTTEVAAPSLPITTSGPFYPPNIVGPVPNLQPTPPETAVPSPGTVAKDINYYKSLIQQHGGDRQETLDPYTNNHNHNLVANPEPVHNFKTLDLKPRIMKPCIYFNSTRGCRHGANCSYMHDAISQQRSIGLPEVPRPKRMKVEREIRGI